MAQYAIEDTTMTALADATRNVIGAYEQVPGDPIPLEVPIISKTTNATGFDTYDGGYGHNQSVYDIVNIPGATKIVIDIAYQNEAGTYDYVQVESGARASMSSSATKYANKTLTRTTKTFENTDTITFYFRSDSSNDSYLGYYAECRGYDENDNLITESIPMITVPKLLTVDEMITGLNNAMAGMRYDDTTVKFGNSAITQGTTIYGDVSPLVGKNDDKPFVLRISPRFSTSAVSYLTFYYDGKGNFTTLSTPSQVKSITITEGKITFTSANTMYLNPWTANERFAVVIY